MQKDSKPVQQQQQGNLNKVEKLSNEFQGRVIEVHSGDQLTIQSIKFGKEGKFCFTNVKAPTILKQNSKPYAFESKEFLRKLCIGKTVTVKMEYKKTFEVVREKYDDAKEDMVEYKEKKELYFATVRLGEQQLALSVVEAGLAQVQKPYSEEETGVLYEELCLAEVKAKEQKKGLHNNLPYKPKHYNDISREVNQAKNLFPHLQQHKKLTGIIDYVLNGSRFKVRCNELNNYFTMVIQGVRCLPEDENFSGYKTWSNKALDYSRKNLLQRDIEFKVNKIDKKGTFQGWIHVDKVDYAETLLKQGLAVSFGGATNQQAYDQLEQQAKSSQTGLWKDNINLQGVKGDFGSKDVQLCDIKSNVRLTEVIDQNEFYVSTPGNSTLSKLEIDLENYDPEGRLGLQKPIKAKTPCLAPFQGQYYRAQVVRESNKAERYQVHFVDYGNYDDVHISDLRKMPENFALTKIAPQVTKCSLAYTLGPYKKNDYYKDSIEVFMDATWDKNILAHTVYKYGDISYVILYEKGKVGPNDSINQYLLSEGLSTLDQQIELPRNFANWNNSQEAAREKSYGVWENKDDE